MTPMRWFRLYAEVSDDPKILMLSPEFRWFWLCLLCVFRKNSDKFPSEKEISIALRVTQSKAKKVIDHLIEAGLIDRTDQGLKPHKWNERQYKSDVSTERVRKFRERHGNVSETPSEQTTEQSRERKIKNPPSPKARAVSPEFLEWYAEYPRREAKGAAEKSYATALKITDAATLLAGARAATARYRDSDPKFIPLPATWLNQRRWLDEPAEGVRKRQTGGGWA